MTWGGHIQGKSVYYRLREYEAFSPDLVVDVR
jgi:hypothetical protein